MTPLNSANIGKEAFFRDLLVPTGQTLEVLLKLASNQMRHEEYARFVHELFEPLNLVSCFVINPDTKDLVPVVHAVECYSNALLTAILSMGSTRAPYVAVALGVSHRGSSSKVTEGLRSGLRYLRAELPKLKESVYEVIGYADAQRHGWLASQMRSASPVTRQGRINKWRTFVRNTSWTRCIEMLDISAVVPASRHTVNRFSTAVGAQKAQLLWTETFAALQDAPGREGDVPVAAASNRLPVGVVVKSTTSGELQVEADFDPKQFFSKEQNKALRAPGRVVSSALRTALASRQFQQACDVPGLADAVQAAATWLQAQRDTKSSVLEVHALWLEEMRLKAVRDKLAQHFNEEERRLLAGIFVSEAAAVATA